MQRPPSRIRMLVALCLLACGLTVVPPDWTDAVRAGVQDATLPGQRIAKLLFERGEEWLLRWRTADSQPADPNGLRELERQVAHWQQRCRQLEVQLALTREQIHRTAALGSSPYLPTAGDRLFVPALLEARLVSKQDTDLWRSALRLGEGSASGMAAEALVIEDDGLQIDQGQTSQVSPGHPVYAGRCVLGKIAQVGRWTSSVTPVTDSRFRAHAQLVRLTSQGPAFGARGIFEGRDGPLCGLKFVPANEVVAVGDRVYTAERESLLPEPMYFGAIVRAELPPGAPYWDIDVEPAARIKDVQTVHVLRQVANPSRMLAD